MYTIFTILVAAGLIVSGSLFVYAVWLILQSNCLPKSESTLDYRDNYQDTMRPEEIEYYRNARWD